MCKTLRTVMIAFSLMVLGSTAGAVDYYGAPGGMQAPAGRVSKPPSSYGESVGLKAGSGISNLLLGWLEIPKNMIATSNQVNVAFGVTGGLVKGVLHTAGRTVGGAIDFFTAPLPTNPIIEPPYIWENIEVETSYGPAFKPQN